MRLWIVSMEEIFVAFSPYRFEKKNYSRALVNGQEMPWAMPVPSQTMSKMLSKFLQQIKNDHYPFETTYSKNNTAHTPILSIINNISKFDPHYKVFCRITFLERFLRSFFLLSPTGGPAKGPFLYFSGPILTDSTLKLRCITIASGWKNWRMTFCFCASFATLYRLFAFFRLYSEPLDML